MTALTVLPGGSESGTQAECTTCGVPYWDECKVLARHLDWLRMRGLSPKTIAGRRGGITKLGRALPVPVLDATKEHLYAWR